MTTVMRQLVTTERVRVLIAAAGMSLWFLLVLAMTKSAGAEIRAEMGLFDGMDFLKGFGLSAITSEQSMLDQMLSVTFNHPIALALLAAVFLSLGARAVQGELEAGTLEVTLARPISRTRYLLAHALFIAGATAFVMVVAGASILAFEALLDVPGTVEVVHVAQLVALGTMVYVAFGMLSLLVSTMLARRGGAMGAAVGVFVVMYAITFMDRIWSKPVIDALGRLSLFHWFDPIVTITGAGVGIAAWLVPPLVAVGALVAACVLLERRDL